ncbi:MAG TPA: hypothetical protein VK892_00170 [Pyrinomonadaceae bacterium]|nr:hypothetical protein [Pyrinomonadaceae bacterium]
MKITKTFLSVFFLTFLIGYVSVLPIKKVSAPKGISIIIPKENSDLPIETKVEEEILEENNDWQEEDETKFKIKLIETGEGFHGDEIQAKSGETWLGLFKEKNKYNLRSVKIKVRRSFDVIVDELEEKTGKDVIVEGKKQPLFLVKNAEMLREGEIKTVFYAPSFDEAIRLQNGFVAEYKLNDKKYNLRVEGGTNSSTLILESENNRQVLYFVGAMGDATWNLYWVGDLDKDGKLDLYADIPVFYNFSQKRLFLSSQAENGRLVKQVALFHTIGC